MAAGQLISLPTGFRSEFLAAAVERYARVAFGANVGLFADAVARPGEGDCGCECRQRTRCLHCIDPGSILIVDPEHHGRHRFDAHLTQRQQFGNRLAHWLRGRAGHAVAALRYKGVEEYKRRDRLKQLFAPWGRRLASLPVSGFAYGHHCSETQPFAQPRWFHHGKPYRALMGPMPSRMWISGACARNVPRTLFLPIFLIRRR
jgi:hypothetical protein